MNIVKKYGIQIIVVLALMGGAFYVGGMSKELQLLRDGGNTVLPSGQAAQPPAPTPTAREVAPITDEDYVKGNRDARIALIEYSDFECPFCQRFHSTAQQVVEEYGDEILWTYRHFPLDSIHPNATPAAIAAECVGKIGGNDAFWSFTDALFDGASLSETSYLSIASDLGIDISTCIANEETLSNVQEDLSTGQKAGVTGTPGNIILNIETGESILLPGALPFAQISQAIDSLL